MKTPSLLALTAIAAACPANPKAPPPNPDVVMTAGPDHVDTKKGAVPGAVGFLGGPSVAVPAPSPDVVLAGQDFVDTRTGAVLGSVAGVSRSAMAVPVPGEPHIYLIEGKRVDARTHTVQPATRNSIRVRDGRVTLSNPDGKTIWSVSSKGRSVLDCAPNDVAAPGRHIVGFTSSLAAFRESDGKTVVRLLAPVVSG